MYSMRNVIYRATNLLNEKVYVGYTSQKFRDRLNVHKKRSNSDDPRWKTKFYNAIRKYGWENFSWEIIEECKDTDTLGEREIYWINHYNSYYSGYNSTGGGDGTLGVNGENCANSKLTEMQVVEVKRMLVEGHSRTYISRKINGVTTHMVSDISLEKTWRHVSVDGWDDFLNNKRVGNQRIREEDVAKIQKMLIERVSYKDIASIYNISQFTVSDIANGRTWKSVSVDGWNEYLSRIKSTGDHHGMSKLTAKQARDIKTLLIQGISRKEIASTFDISIGTITAIVLERNWSQIEVEGWKEWISKNKRKPPTLLKDSDVVEIKKMLILGVKQKDIASNFKISVSAVSMIARNNKWSHIDVEGWKEYLEAKAS